MNEPSPVSDQARIAEQARWFEKEVYSQDSSRSRYASGNIPGRRAKLLPGDGRLWPDDLPGHAPVDRNSSRRPGAEKALQGRGFREIRARDRRFRNDPGVSRPTSAKGNALGTDGPGGQALSDQLPSFDGRRLLMVEKGKALAQAP